MSSPKSATSDDTPESEYTSATLPQTASSDRSLGPVDALSAYMAQLAKYAPISREEEHALAVRWVEDGDE
ncbi:MAG: RNA polymerase subunit sigma-70, partial [Myxococcota bacterium]